MERSFVFALGFLSAVQALPTSWTHATVKRGADDIATEYDYIVGTCPYEVQGKMLTTHSGRRDGWDNGS